MFAGLLITGLLSMHNIESCSMIRWSWFMVLVFRNHTDSALRNTDNCHPSSTIHFEQIHNPRHFIPRKRNPLSTVLNCVCVGGGGGGADFMHSESWHLRPRQVLPGIRGIIRILLAKQQFQRRSTCTFCGLQGRRLIP